MNRTPSGFKRNGYKYNEKQQKRQQTDEGIKYYS